MTPSYQGLSLLEIILSDALKPSDTFRTWEVKGDGPFSFSNCRYLTCVVTGQSKLG